jgi:hypothetical protein
MQECRSNLSLGRSVAFRKTSKVLPWSFAGKETVLVPLQIDSSSRFYDVYGVGVWLEAV